MKFACGPKERILSAISSGKIAKESLILTSDDTIVEILFYDKDGQLKQADRKSKFTSLDEARTWATAWGEEGDLITVKGSAGWLPYYVDTDKTVKQLPSSGGGSSGSSEGIQFFNSDLDFPTNGSHNMLYVDYENRYLYLWDSTEAKYAPMNYNFQNIIINGGQI